MKSSRSTNVGPGETGFYSSHEIYAAFDALPAPLRHAVAHDRDDVETLTVLRWWERQVEIYDDMLRSGELTMHRLAMAAAKTYSDESGDGYAFTPPIRKRARLKWRGRHAA